MSRSNAYAAIIEEIFESKFEKGMTQVDFERSDITAAAKRRGVRRPSNIGDVVYSAVKVLMERHYKLVEPGELTAEDLAAYRRRT